MNFLINVLKLIRPHQYVKNAFIFGPLFFAGQFTTVPLLLDSLIAFAAFSLAASSIYVLNDYLDIEDDKQHPKKKNRPLASGAISKWQALIIMAVMFVASVVLLLPLPSAALGILAIYVVQNIAYSVRLKHVALLDVTIIAIGFVLRLFIGSVATGIPLSSWIVVMTFLIALFLALAKRRDDILIYLDTGKKMRRVVDGYNLQLIDTAMAIMASVVIVAYITYATSADSIAHAYNPYLYLTALFVILGILRYLQIVYVFLDSGSPTKVVLKDRFIQLTVLAWIITFTWILY